MNDTGKEANRSGQCTLCSQVRIYGAAALGRLKTPSVPVKVESVVGIFTKAQRVMAKEYYDRTLARSAALEGKAARLLALFAVLTPFVTSIVLLDTSRFEVGHETRVALAVLGIGAVITILLGFLCAFRAGRVQNLSGLAERPLVKDGAVRAHADEAATEDFHARGYLTCALSNDALGDQIGTLVKGAEWFAMASLALLVTGIGLSYFGSQAPRSEPSKIEGIVTVTPSANLAKTLQRLGKGQGSLSPLVIERDSNTTTKRVQLLSVHVEELSRQVQILRNEGNRSQARKKDPSHQPPSTQVHRPVPTQTRKKVKPHQPPAKKGRRIPAGAQRLIDTGLGPPVISTH